MPPKTWLESFSHYKYNSCCAAWGIITPQLLLLDTHQNIIGEQHQIIITSSSAWCLCTQKNTVGAEKMLNCTARICWTVRRNQWRVYMVLFCSMWRAQEISGYFEKLIITAQLTSCSYSSSSCSSDDRITEGKMCTMMMKEMMIWKKQVLMNNNTSLLLRPFSYKTNKWAGFYKVIQAKKSQLAARSASIKEEPALRSFCVCRV